jgi:hypothetical protein
LTKLAAAVEESAALTKLAAAVEESAARRPHSKNKRDST